MIRLSTLCAGLAAVCLAAGAPRAAADPVNIDTSALQADECPDMRSYYGTSHVVCGTLRVFESAGKTGREIDLAVVVITPDDEEAAKRTPTIFIHGGPGAGVVESWVSMEGEPQVRAGPFILFDQRGVGRSAPKVCPATDDDTEDTSGDDEKVAANAVAKCAVKASKTKTDLAAYGTDVTVRDMEEIRLALQIDRWNIMGVSYGTTVALAYVAAHPDRTRAAVLDSVYPPEVPGLTSVVPEAVASLQKMNALCMGQPRCRNRFGDIVAATEDAMRTLNAKPLRLSPSADGQERVLSAATMFSFVQSLLMDASNWYAIPKFVDDVRNRRDSQLVGAVYDTFSESADDGGIWIATECRERAPFDHLHAGDAPKWSALTRAGAPDLWLKACEKWPVRLRTNWQTPHDVTVPTLVIGGGLDPITPASDAQFVAGRLGGKAKLMLLPYASHSASSSFPCVKEAITAFLKQPQAGPARPCERVNGPPEFAADVVTFDINSSPKAFLTAFGVVEPNYWIWIATLALFSVLLWPIWALRPAPAAAAPVWERSSFWLTTSTALLLAWASARSIPMANTDPGAAYWNYYGIPAHAWPAFSLIVPAIAASLAGAAVTASEVMSESLRPLEILHRACVLAALSFVFAAVLYYGAVPTSFGQLADDVVSLRRTIGL